MPGTTESCPTSSERGAVPTGGLCLNSSRWDALHNFAAATDSKIVFGLSYPEVGSPDKKSDDDGTDGGSGIWNSTQAEALFAYSNQRGFRPSTTLFGFELGEELTKFKAGTPAFAAYVASYHRAAALLRSVFDHKDDVPKLMGPCPGMAWPQLATWYPSFLKGTEGALDISVYHSYNQIRPDPPRALFLNVTPPSGDIATQHGSSPGDTGWQGKAMAGWARTAGIPVWLGEGGPHNGGGGGEYASTFVSSFGYLDTLGTLAALNHSVFARQTLVGGNYELLRCSSGQPTGPEPAAGCDFEPHPDYYVALLWHRLMGTKALSSPVIAPASAETVQSVRLHAHCTAGGKAGSISIAFANMADTVSFELALPASFGTIREEYHLTAANSTEGFSARVLSLNAGPPLHTMASPAAEVLPRMTPMAGNNDSTVVLAPVSLGFFVFPNAEVAACK